ncbi:hypothetical protein ES703_112155 [subsurface metagenome]
MGESDQLQGKVGDEHKGSSCPQTESDVVQACQLFGISLVPKEVLGEQAYEYHHTEPGGDG